MPTRSMTKSMNVPRTFCEEPHNLQTDSHTPHTYLKAYTLEMLCICMTQIHTDMRAHAGTPRYHDMMHIHTSVTTASWTTVLTHYNTPSEKSARGTLLNTRPDVVRRRQACAASTLGWMVKSSARRSWFFLPCCVINCNVSVALYCSTDFFNGPVSSSGLRGVCWRRSSRSRVGPCRVGSASGRRRFAARSDDRSTAPTTAHTELATLGTYCSSSFLRSRCVRSRALAAILCLSWLQHCLRARSTAARISTQSAETNSFPVPLKGTLVDTSETKTPIRSSLMLILYDPQGRSVAAWVTRSEDCSKIKGIRLANRCTLSPAAMFLPPTDTAASMIKACPS
eukprot:m.43086 g.43086  ORF g.43086 m.43086 type:complete len:339 (-) comp6361_c0_seq1:1191-2207(-)